MIDMYEIVRPGDRVDIESADGREGSEKKYYITKVYDIKEDNLAEIMMPMEKTHLIVLSVGAQYELFFYAGKGIYACRAEVVDRRNDNGVAVAVLQPITALQRHQRREYYRYDCIIGMNARELSDQEAAIYEEKGRMDLLAEPADKAVIVDISGGGVRFVSAAHYESGKLVHCRFILPVKGVNKAHDLVVRILSAVPVANSNVNKEYRGQYLKLEEGDREDIIRFIFEEERKVRAKQHGY